MFPSKTKFLPIHSVTWSNVFIDPPFESTKKLFIIWNDDDDDDDDDRDENKQI